MKNRSKTDISAQILDAATEGLSRPELLYRAYLSYGQLKHFLAALIQNGLIEYVEGEMVYRTTEKGRRFLRFYNQMEQFIPAELRPLA